MPLPLEPNETFEIILDSDKNKPREDQPRFIYRHLNCSQWRVVANFRNSLEKLKNDKSAENILDRMMTKLKETATTNLIGWVNMKDLRGEYIPFDIEKFEDIVGLAEANELIVKLEDYRLMPADKKKFDLPLESSTEGSVKDAEGEINVKTDPQ